MKIFIIIIFFCLIPALSFASDPWSIQDIALESTYIALHVIDWGQTRDIAKNPDEYHEAYNPLLGNHPSKDKVDLWFLTTTVTHILITNYLPSECRPYFQGVTIGIAGSLVLINFSVGLKIAF
jgi:hypothetical protein